MNHVFSITGFQPIRPRYEVPQEQMLDWIASCHAHAENSAHQEDDESFYKNIREKLERLGVGKECISSRGVHIHDLFESDISKRELYPVNISPKGKGFQERSQFFEREVTEIFHRFYQEDPPLPSQLIHVTCTGYVAPSPAQKLISSKRAGHISTVTHAYHMGCYGALAALRIGAGFLSYAPTRSSLIDIVHTELCSLHMHPLNHSMEQLLVESLFGDGFMKYSLVSQTDQPHLKVLALLEEMIPESSHCMTWRCEDHGLGMTLSKDVPAKVAQHLKGYLERLCHQAGYRMEDLQNALFAIHPGGPKIVKQVGQLFSLQPFQIHHSLKILYQFGNMSSATLPYIWNEIGKDSNVPSGTLVISLAFGPGLIISGGLLQTS